MIYRQLVEHISKFWTRVKLEFNQQRKIALGDFFGLYFVNFVSDIKLKGFDTE